MHSCWLVSSCGMWRRFDSSMPPAPWKFPFERGHLCTLRVESAIVAPGWPLGFVWSDCEVDGQTCKLSPACCFLNFLLIFSDYSFLTFNYSRRANKFSTTYTHTLKLKACAPYTLVVRRFIPQLLSQYRRVFFVAVEYNFFSAFIPRSVSTLVAFCQVSISLGSPFLYLDHLNSPGNLSSPPGPAVRLVGLSRARGASGQRGRSSPGGIAHGPVKWSLNPV